MKTEPVELKEYPFHGYNAKYHKDAHPFAALVRCWRGGQPEPNYWMLYRTHRTMDRAKQSAGDLTRTMGGPDGWGKASDDGGKTYQPMYWRFAFARLIIPSVQTP